MGNVLKPKDTGSEYTKWGFGFRVIAFAFIYLINYQFPKLNLDDRVILSYFLKTFFIYIGMIIGRIRYTIHMSKVKEKDTSVNFNRIKVVMADALVECASVAFSFFWTNVIISILAVIPITMIVGRPLKILFSFTTLLWWWAYYASAFTATNSKLYGKDFDYTTNKDISKQLKIAIGLYVLPIIAIILSKYITKIPFIGPAIAFNNMI
jgi:hypothetical protein